MFAKTIIDSDAFLDMPISARLLYYDLAMRADDDGFLNNAKKIQRTVGCSEDDLKLLIAKNFIIPFASGVVVIKHWKIHNYIRTDRYKETMYQEEKSQLFTKENKAYTLGIPNGYQMDTQVSLGKASLDKDRVAEVSGLATEENGDCGDDECVDEYPDNQIKAIGGLGKGVVHMTDKQLDTLVERLGIDAFNHYLEKLANFIIKNDAHIANHFQTMLKWSEEDARCT